MRKEFSAKVKAERFRFCGGHCESCTRKLFTGDIHFDHDNPDGLTGEPTFENCRALCRSCHLVKTKTDVTRIAKAKRSERKQIGIKKPGWTIPGRKFDGSPIPSRRRG